MKLVDFIYRNNEKPLDNIINDGGYTSIFRTIGCIGDSLSSGEFETLNEDGTHNYYDMFEYSWGQFIARTCGSKVYNFSKGGMSAKTYIESFAEENDYYNPELKCQAYIIALGENDLGQVANGKYEFGTFEDIKNKNLKTFMGCYTEIVRKYKEISPDAKFFFVTLPKNSRLSKERNESEIIHRDFLYKLCEHFDNCYVIDIKEYGLDYDYEGELRRFFFLNGHMNPMGYVFTAKVIISYIDYIIRNNPRDFDETGFINTGIKNFKKE